MKVKDLFVSITLIFLCLGNTYSQDVVSTYSLKIDSLQQLINAHPQDDEQKVLLLNEYARQSFYNEDFLKGFMATRDGLELSKKLDFEGGIIMYYLTLHAFHGNAFNDMHTYYQKQAQWLSKSMGDRQLNYYAELEIPDVNWGNNYEEILAEFTSILGSFTNDDDIEIQANLLMVMAAMNKLLLNLEETVTIQNRIIELFTELNQIYPVFLFSTYKMGNLKSMGKVDEAKEIELDLIRLFARNENENTVGLIANALASGYAASGRYLLSIEYYHKSIEIFERIGDHEMLAKTWYELAIAYEGINMNSKAYESYAKSITELELMKNIDFVNMVYGAMVFPAIAIEKYDEAKEYMAFALRDTVNNNGIYLMGRFNDANGQILKKQGKYGEAIPFFKKAMDEFAQDDRYTWTAPYMPLYLTECFYEIGDYTKALEYGLRCLELEKSLNLNQTLTKKRASLWLSKIYRKMGNLTEAYSYLQIHQEISEESERLDELNRISDAEIQSVLSKSKKEINDLELERLQTYQQNRIQRLWLFSIAGALLSVLVLALILFRNNKNKQKANALLQKQKEEIQSTLEKLKSTQAQLIQSEKMASLGELTAGIAHEIQNPLNFVNNFSEVSAELVDEIQDIRRKTQDRVPESEEDEILEDVKQNLEKINHHGKRADAIVKGMLEHSRTGSGEKELTDINTLTKEYLNLAYQSFKSKNEGVDIEVITDFDSSLPKSEIVRSDIGKVLLNILNNAFYACSQPSKGLEPLEGFQPLVTVTTKLREGSPSSLSRDLGRAGGSERKWVQISISDNGPGIPDTIKDKIFQPFFTTKPTGQGTGLGLSLSYDIIKAHGGELKVETEEGKGSEFLIMIPITKNPVT